jgi:choline dehydrogenase
MTVSRSPDVIICGAGTAGAVVAGRLVEAGARVLVLEAGPDYGAFAGGGWPADLLNAAQLPGGHDWGYTGAGAGGQALAFDRARVAGGCSSHNGCAQTCGWAGDFDRLAQDTGFGSWSAAAVEPLFARVAERLRIRRYTDDEVQPFQRAFLDAAVACGLPLTDDLDDLAGGVGCGCERVNIQDGVRWNTAFGYLDPVRDSAGLEIRPGMLVDRVLLDGDLVRGVRVIADGGPQELAAPTVVIAAGAYGSPEILLRSGIGPVADLAPLGIDVTHDLPGVGANLHDQPAVNFEYAGTPELAADLADFAADRWMPEEQAIAKLATSVVEGPYDIHVYPWVEPDPEQASGWRCVIPAAVLTPRSRGRLRLRSADPTTRAELDHAFLSDRDGADLTALVEAAAWVRRALTHPGIARYCGAPLAVPELHGDGSLEQWSRETHSHYWHPAGTCRMGPPGDAAAVTDGRGRVHGIDGLLVADASLFPSLPRSTPAWPVAVVGEVVSSALTSA